MRENQLLHYSAKLAYETDSWDLYAALNDGKPWVVVDGRSAEAYEQEHIPSAINLPHKDICTTNVEGLYQPRYAHWIFAFNRHAGCARVARESSEFIEFSIQ